MVRIAIRHLPSKSYSIWARKWGHAAQYPSQGLDITMKKVLIYYPKHPEALAPITSEIRPSQSRASPSSRDQLRKLFSSVTSRYKKELLACQNVDITSHSVRDWSTCRTASSIRLSQQSHISDQDLEDLEAEDFSKKCIHAVKKSIRANKRLRILELDAIVISIAKIFKDLRYVRSLISLHIHYFPDMSLMQFRKAINGSKFSLETVTLTGRMQASNPIEVFRIILELPKLKKFCIDCNIPDFDVDRIPFGAFNKRNISYDIRVPHAKENFMFSLPNDISLAAIDFLGLNFNKNWASWYPKWDISLEEHVKMQQSVQRSLWLYPSGEFGADISELLVACKNIRVLDIVLSNASYEPETYGQGYTNLRHLTNLQHIFIHLSHISNYRTKLVRQLPGLTSTLFGNLKHCARTLKSVCLHIDGEPDPEKGINAFTEFFEVCSDTLKDITLKFTFDEYCEGKNVSLFYAPLAKLRYLTRATLIYHGYSDGTFKGHSIGLKQLFSSQMLEELKVSAKSITSDLVIIDLMSLNNLRNLSLECSTLNIDSEFFKSFHASVNSLKNLELSLDSLDKQMWYKLLNKLDSLQALEAIKLRISKAEISEKDTVGEIRLCFKKNVTRKFIAYGQGTESTEVFIFIRDPSFYVKEDVNNFFGRGFEGLPKERFHNLYMF